MPKKRSADQKWRSRETMKWAMDEAEEAMQTAMREVEALWAVALQAEVE